LFNNFRSPLQNRMENIKMKRKISICLANLVILSCLVTHSAFADPDEPYSSQFLDLKYSLLADASSEKQVDQVDTQLQEVGQGARFDLGFLHKCLGYGTLVSAGVTAGSSSSVEFHEAAGYAAAGLALATCITGFIEYSDYFNLEDGLSAYNIHVMLGTIGALGFASAVALGANTDGGGEHAGLGISSAIVMVLPVIVVRW